MKAYDPVEEEETRSRESCDWYSRTLTAVRMVVMQDQALLM